VTITQNTRGEWGGGAQSEVVGEHCVTSKTNGCKGDWVEPGGALQTIVYLILFHNDGKHTIISSQFMLRKPNLCSIFSCFVSRVPYTESCRRRFNQPKNIQKHRHIFMKEEKKLLEPLSFYLVLLLPGRPINE